MEYNIYEMRDEAYLEGRKDAEEEIEILKKAIKLLKKSNDFYADKFNWETYMGGEDDYAMIKKDQTKQPKVYNYFGQWQSKRVGGKRARKANERLKELAKDCEVLRDIL